MKQKPVDSLIADDDVVEASAESEDGTVGGSVEPAHLGPTLEELLALLAEECGCEEASAFELLECELGLKRGALADGSAERGLLPARDLVALVRAMIDSG